MKRILGSSDFVTRLFLEAEEKERETLRLRKNIPDLGLLGKRIVKGEGIREDDLRSGSRRREVIEARRFFCQLAVKKMGYCGGDVARFLGVTTSAVNKAANSEEVILQSLKSTGLWVGMFPLPFSSMIQPTERRPLQGQG